MNSQAVDSLWKAISEERFGVVMCGADEAVYARALEHLLAALSQDYTLVLLSADCRFESEYDRIRLINDDSLSGLDFARSALRQDPDCLALDLRGEECLQMLAQAKLTGHRTVRHSPEGASQAFATARQLLAAHGSAFEREVLLHELFAELDEEGVWRVWQVQETDGLQLVSVLERQLDSWQATGRLQTSSPFVPGPPTPEALDVPADWTPPTQPVSELLESALGSLRRTAYAPIRGATGTAGRYGGLPKLSPAAPWPCCGDCGTAMSLILEVELACAPMAFQESTATQGVFQFFYCCSHSCTTPSAWEPFQANSCARVVRGDAARAESADCHIFEEVPISKWQALEEGPGWEEREQALADTPLKDEPWMADLEEMSYQVGRPDELQESYGKVLEFLGIEPAEAAKDLALLANYPGDKLLGWPCWTQGVEYPRCQACGRQMDVLFQLNNDGAPAGPPGYSSALGQVFAGDGNGHVYRCPCNGSMTFAWACG